MWTINKYEMKTESKINKVTTTNLNIALRMCDIEINKAILDKVIDLVELIEEKGDDVTIKDVCELQVA
jgi:uncharacterized protein YnzC (UPF0291/DUF896 family)